MQKNITANSKQQTANSKQQTANSKQQSLNLNSPFSFSYSALFCSPLNHRLKLHHLQNPQ
jgi:hypothetical protein